MPIQARAATLAINRDGFAGFKDLPIELVMLVCTFCHPRSLIMLARTSKPMRKLLMDGSNFHLWKGARESIGLVLPDEWDPLPESLIAHFMFEDVCQEIGCHEQALEKVHELGARYCRKCLLTNFLSIEEVKAKYAQFDDDILSRLAIKLSKMTTARKFVRLKKKSAWKRLVSKGPFVYYKPDLDDFCSRLERGDNIDRIIFDIGQTAFQRKDLAEQLKNWDFKEEREDTSMKSNRKNDLEFKILGKNRKWKITDLPHEDLKWLEFIRKPYPLTKEEFKENRRMLEDIVREHLRTRPERNEIYARSITRHAILIHNLAHESQPHRIIPLDTLQDLCIEEGEVVE